MTTTTMQIIKKNKNEPKDIGKFNTLTNDNIIVLVNNKYLLGMDMEEDEVNTILMTYFIKNEGILLSSVAPADLNIMKNIILFYREALNNLKYPEVNVTVGTLQASLTKILTKIYKAQAECV